MEETNSAVRFTVGFWENKESDKRSAYLCENIYIGEYTVGAFGKMS